MALKGLLAEPLKMIFFGGKGGVGKTTWASVTAQYLADNNMNTLLISTDPAHSVSDSLGVEVGDEIRRIEGVKNLSALEISAAKTLSKFKAAYEDELKRIFDTSTYLDTDDVDSVLALPMPGIDEIMGLKSIVDLIEEGMFEKYVIDTAPTGHALRLLTLPGLLDDWIKVTAKIRWKYRCMVTSFAGKYTPDCADDFLMSMKKAVKNIETLLKDGNRCEFIVVTIPEDMAVRETERLIKSLTQYNMKAKQLIINNVIPVTGECNFCRQRRDMQDTYIREMTGKFGDMNITMAPLQPREVKGRADLQKLGRIFFDS